MAVYTKLTKEEIVKHLEQNYKIGELQDFKEIIAGIDNSNFIITTSTVITSDAPQSRNKHQKYILTIFESRINPEELPFFIDLKGHLSKKGVRCPAPILNNEGSSISDLKGKKSSIVTFLEGSMLEPRQDGYYDNITSKHCFEIGKTTAQMHLAAQDFDQKRENDIGVFGFKDLLGKFRHLMQDYQSGLLEKIDAKIDFLTTNWEKDLPSAPSHLDLFPDNVFFGDDQNLSGVIDFYFAANDLMVYDLAVVVNAWCFDENNEFSQEKYQNMLKGYESKRKLSDAEKDFLKIALAAASMRFLLTRLHDMFFTPKDSLVNVKNPAEYIKKLEFFTATAL